MGISNSVIYSCVWASRHQNCVFKASEKLPSGRNRRGLWCHCFFKMMTPCPRLTHGHCYFTHGARTRSLQAMEDYWCVAVWLVRFNYMFPSQRSIALSSHGCSCCVRHSRRTPSTHTLVVYYLFLNGGWINYKYWASEIPIYPWTRTKSQGVHGVGLAQEVEQLD